MIIRERNSGTTLIELLVSIGLLALVAAATGRILVNALDFSKRSKFEMNNSQKALVLITRIRKELHKIIPYGDITISGDSNFISFVTLKPTIRDNIRSEVPTLLKYGFNDKDDGEIYRMAAIFSEIVRDSIAICGNVSSLNIFYANIENNKLLWRDNWMADLGIPTAIKLSISFSDFKHSNTEGMSFEQIIFIPLGRFWEPNEVTND